MSISNRVSDSLPSDCSLFLLVIVNTRNISYEYSVFHSRRQSKKRIIKNQQLVETPRRIKLKPNTPNEDNNDAAVTRL